MVEEGGVSFAKGTQNRNNQTQCHIQLLGEKDCQKEPVLIQAPSSWGTYCYCY
jgi:hypothetical protein